MSDFEPPKEPIRKKFSRKSFMSPNPDRPKYKGRDQEIVLTESARRKQWMPVIEIASDIVSKEQGYLSPMLEIRGSVAINKSSSNSDLDIAVIVPVTHSFRSKSEEWLTFSKALEGIALESGRRPNFKIHSVLISEEEFEKKYRNVFLTREDNHLDRESPYLDILKSQDISIMVDGETILLNDLHFSQEWLDSFRKSRNE